MDCATSSSGSAIIAEAVLSPECHITVRIGKAMYRIGSKEEFLHRRLAVQAAVQPGAKGQHVQPPAARPRWGLH